MRRGFSGEVAGPGALPPAGSRGRAPVVLLLLLGAAGGSPSGEWVGTLKTIAGTCPDTQPSDLVVSGRRITFVPGDGVLALTGKPGADPDALHAQLLGTDMNHKPLPMVFEARFADGAVAGTYGTPTCRASITMHRPTDTGLRRLLGH